MHGHSYCSTVVEVYSRTTLRVKYTLKTYFCLTQICPVYIIKFGMLIAVLYWGDIIIVHTMEIFLGHGTCMQL